MKVTEIAYENVPTSDLMLFDGNPRRGNVDQIAESLNARGQYRPIVVNRGTMTGRAMEVLAGNHTLMAARQLNMATISCAIIDVDSQTAKAIVAADNRLADLGVYDDEALSTLLEDLDSLEGTGYSESDLEDILAASAIPEELTDRDEAPATPEDEPITVPGDVYELGPHRVMCGDATNSAAVLDMLLHDGAADCVWTDPPYGVDYEGKRTKCRKIENDSGADLTELLHGALATIILGARPGAPVYMASPQGPLLHDFQQAFIDAGIVWRQNLVWIKHHFVIGRTDYHYKHEPILQGTTPEPDEVEDENPLEHSGILYGFTDGGEGRLGRGGDHWYGDNKQTTVFQFPKPPASQMHPTMKPVDLVLRMLQNSCPPGGIVLDLFGGSGTTLIAAHHRGAHARLVELDPKYVDVICRRWQEHTGIMPKRDGVEVNFIGTHTD